MIVSPRISPQLNKTICSCRCGCGCGCAGQGTGDDSERLSDSVTAIDSSDSDDDDEEGFARSRRTHSDGFDSDGPNHMDRGIQSPRASSHHVIVWLLGEPLVGGEQVSFHPQLFESQDTAESLLVETLSAENQSHPVSTRGSVHMVSPGPGIGSWFVPEENWIEDVQRVYIFTPLRLSAEYQHARGKAVEHLLVPDEAFVPDMVQEWSV